MSSSLIKANGFLNPTSGRLKGADISSSLKTLGELEGVFANEGKRRAMDQDRVVYRVQMQARVDEGTVGGLYFGTSFLQPGKVGNEYFMTRGHFHARRETAEYYWCIHGTGALIMMNEAGETWAENLEPGTLHYIPGHTAHRLANTGDTELAVGACWPSDAGHDYAAISHRGFTARLLCINGKPSLNETNP
jgi:glucose-6-phosphate isomerase